MVTDDQSMTSQSAENNDNDVSEDEMPAVRNVRKRVAVESYSD